MPGGTKWDHAHSASTLAAALRGAQDSFTLAGLVVSICYFIGVSCVVFHFANGLWTAAITWGLTVSEAAQKRWGYVCSAMGVALMGMAWASVIGFALLDPTEAWHMENRLHDNSVPPLPAEGVAGGDQRRIPPITLENPDLATTDNHRTDATQDDG